MEEREKDSLAVRPELRLCLFRAVGVIAIQLRDEHRDPAVAIAGHANTLGSSRISRSSADDNRNELPPQSGLVVAWSRPARRRERLADDAAVLVVLDDRELTGLGNPAPCYPA